MISNDDNTPPYAEEIPGRQRLLYLCTTRLTGIDDDDGSVTPVDNSLKVRCMSLTVSTDPRELG
jgi:hypothetical protein